MDSQYPKRIFHIIKIWLMIDLIALILGLLIGFALGKVIRLSCSYHQHGCTSLSFCVRSVS